MLQTIGSNRSRNCSPHGQRQSNGIGEGLQPSRATSAKMSGQRQFQPERDAAKEAETSVKWPWATGRPRKCSTGTWRYQMNGQSMANGHHGEHWQTLERRRDSHLVWHQTCPTNGVHLNRLLRLPGKLRNSTPPGEFGYPRELGPAPHSPSSL